MIVSGCELDIELDDPNRTYRAGDELTGRVVVEVDKDCPCRGLSVVCKWNTQGRGTPTSGSARQISLFSGEWTAGERYEYPFSIQLPNGPCSYNGHYLNIVWSVCAEADIPWAFDPDAECDFIVKPADEPSDEPYRTGDPDCRSHRDAEQRAESGSSVVGKVLLGCFFVPFLVMPLFFMAAAFAATGFSLELIPFVAIPLVFLGIIGFVIYKMFLRNKLAEMQLGDIEIDVDDHTVPAGEETLVNIDIPPESETEINEVSVTLRGQEKVKYRRGTKTRTRRHTLYEEDHVIPESRNVALAEGEAAHFQTTVSVPPDAPPSFYARRNWILWKARVHVDIEGWPDWKQSIPLDVVPEQETVVEGEPVALEDEQAPGSAEQALW